MIIDAHTHFYDPSRPQGVPWPPADNRLLYRTVLPADHRAVAGPEGIAGTVVVEASAWFDDNQWILDLAADDPWILGFVGHVDPGPGFAERLGSLAEHPLFLGIRLGGRVFEALHEGTVMQDLETLGKHLLALDVLVRDEQIDGVAAVARLFPELRIVIDHVAHVSIDGGEPDRAWQERISRAAAASPNVFCKVSALAEQAVAQPAPTDPDYYRPTLEALWRIFGPHRLLFGSNWPVCERAAPMRGVVGMVRACVEGLGPEAGRAFWCQNARRAYRFTER